MTVLMKHIQEKDRDEMIFKNGRNTISFTFDRQGEGGWAFNVYKGEEYLAGFNVLGNRISGPYDSKEKPIKTSGFDNEKDSPNCRFYADVANDLGVINIPLFVAEGRPFKHITFCDSNGSRAIDLNFDEAGKLTSVSRSKYAPDKEDTFVYFENLDNPKLSRQMQLGWKHDGVYHLDEKTQRGHLLNRLKSTSSQGVSGLSQGNTR